MYIRSIHFFFASLPAELPSKANHFQSIQITVELTNLPPKVLELLSKGLDLQLPILVHQFETFEFLASNSEPYDTKAYLEPQFLELNLDDLISSLIHIHPSISTNPKEENNIYTNILAFEYQDKIISKV